MPSSVDFYTLSLPDALPISDQPKTFMPSAAAAFVDSLSKHTKVFGISGGGDCRGIRVFQGRQRQGDQEFRPLANGRFGLDVARSEEHTSELQSPCNLVCRLLSISTLFPYPTLFRSRISRRLLCLPLRPLSSIHYRNIRKCSAFQEAAIAGESASFKAARGRVIRNSAPWPTADLASMLPDRKSTRLNSSHLVISYAVFCRFLHSFPTRRSSDLGSAEDFYAFRCGRFRRFIIETYESVRHFRRRRLPGNPRLSRPPEAG